MGLALKLTDGKAKKPLSPKVATAIRLYATGRYTIEEAAKACRMSHDRLSVALSDPRGQEIMRRVQAELDHRMQGLYEKVINTLEEGLDHPDASVALAAANLWLRTTKGQKVEVNLTAEDVVQRIMNGTWEDNG